MTSVAVTGPTRLEIAWDDGHAASVDFAEIIGHNALSALRKPKQFARVQIGVDGWSLEWPQVSTSERRSFAAGPPSSPASSCRHWPSAPE
ncbi:MAG: DUF2442 domain-containing protein [Alphaproteobacteria bacterium]|nr:DUF2442 domain-containing protein [Alphaproteobacteria bacterium]